MLKVKKKIQKSSTNQDKLNNLKNEIKNSVKNLYLKDQKNKKTINDYANLIMKIRNEYAQLQKGNNQLNIKIQKYGQYFQDFDQKYKMQYYVKKRPKRKRMQYYDESDQSDSYVTETRKRPREQKRKIYYDDDVDGVSYKPDSPTEEEQEEDESPKKIKKNN